MNDNIDRIIGFRRTILSWYSKKGRKFYWRNSSISNYKKVIAEVLLQKTNAQSVSKFYPDFIQRFPNWVAIARTNLDELEESLKPVGLQHQRSKRMHAMASEMVRRNNRIPSDYETLLKIPMVGQYIANSIMSVVFDKPSPMLDVNMARVLERYFGKRTKADIRYDEYLQKLSFQVVATKNSRIVNWAILDYGALVCKKRNPKCDSCILSKGCLYFKRTN